MLTERLLSGGRTHSAVCVCVWGKMDDLAAPQVAEAQYVDDTGWRDYVFRLRQNMLYKDNPCVFMACEYRTNRENAVIDTEAQISTGISFSKLTGNLGLVQM